MLNYELLAQAAEEAGFSAYAPLRVSAIELKPEVRDMCASNSCGQYGKIWSCPPGCGTLEQCAQRLKQFTAGILVQTVGEIEDSYDVDAMIKAETIHKKHVDSMHTALRSMKGGVLALGSGCCTRCAICTYPDQPCRFPGEMVSSMEAYGILVLQVCRDHGLPYYYGPDKIAYTSCFLL